MSEETEEDPQPVSEDNDPAQDPWYKRAQQRAAEKLEAAKTRVETKVDVDRVLSSAKTVLEVGSDAADVLVHLSNGVTVPGAAALTMRAVNSIRELRSRTPEQHFADGYKPLSLRGMDQTLYDAFVAEAGVELDPVPAMYDDTPAFTATCEEVDFGWALSSGGGRRSRGRGYEGRLDQAEVQGCWIRDDQDEDEALRILGRFVWRHHASMRLGARQGDRDRGISVTAESTEDVLPSETGRKIYEEKIKSSLDVGDHRSVFLIGEAGVGKTQMMRYIADLHGGLRLRFKLADLAGLTGTQITHIVSILRPDVLLIDDFDRFIGGAKDYESDHTGKGMFDPLEEINRKVPLFMVSANFSENITEALLRPQRFDEIVVIECLEPELVEKMLPGAPAKMVKAIQKHKLPMSHVVELAKRAKRLGWDWKAAEKELEDLAQRSQRVIRLNKKKTRRKKKTLKQKLPGKSQRQKAAMLDQNASSVEKKAHRLLERAAKLRADAERDREKAQEWREKAVRAEERAKEVAAKKKAKKTPKKKKKKKAKKKTKKTTKEKTSKKTTPDPQPETDTASEPETEPMYRSLEAGDLRRRRGKKKGRIRIRKKHRSKKRLRRKLG